MPLKVLSTAKRYEALPPSAVAILGDYEEEGTNHGRTVYKRLNTRRGTVRQAQVYLFYWDDRNGKDMMGWYFGNAIGGGQVWGRSTNLEDETSESSQPPQFGWRCPVDGPVQQHIQCVAQGSRQGAMRSAVKQMVPHHDGAPPAKWRRIATCTLTASMAGHSESEHSAPVAVLLGDYAAVRTNHGRKVFRKASGLKVELWLYYWDDRDGDEMSGWWFGDRVGGEGVYAHAASHGPMPPRIGWRIPHDGAVVPSFTLSVKGARGDADMSVEARMNDAKDLVIKAEASVDSAIGLADQILKGTAEVLEESVEAVRERLEAERAALLEAKASVESHSEACVMSTEMPEATEAELSVLQERLDAQLGRLSMELKRVDGVLAQHRAAAAAAAAATQRLKEAEARDSVAQPLTPPGMFQADEAADDEMEEEFLGGLVKPELHQDGSREPPADEVQEDEPEPSEVAAARRLLKPARDSAAKAEHWLQELEKMAAPWANGNELVSEAEGSLALDACEVLLAEAEPGLQLSCTFLRDQVEQVKELPFSVPQSKVLEEMVSLMRTVEAAYLKVLEAKVQTAWRRTVLRVPDILGMVVGAEEQVMKLQSLAAVLFEDTLDKSELADRLTRAARDVVTSQEVCMAACSEAKQAIQQKQKDSEVTESPAFSSCIASLEARIEAAEGRIKEARQAADTLEGARRSLAARHEAFAKVDKALDELELLTMPMGDESKSEDEEEGTAKAVASAQDALSEWEESTKSLHKSTSCPALKFALQRLMDAKGPALHLRLREAVEFVEDWLWNALSRVYAKELQEKFSGVESVFTELEAAEAPFLKGLEVLSGQQAEETFQACEAAATHAKTSLAEAMRNLDERCVELRRRFAGCKEAPLAEQEDKAPEEGALKGCRAKLQSFNERLEAFKAETQHRKQLAMVEV